MKIGFTAGAFDEFGDVHREFLTACRRHCDYLIVAVITDQYCRWIHGPDSPKDPLERRMLHARAFAEAVVPFRGSRRPLIIQIRPDVVFVPEGDAAGPFEDITVRIGLTGAPSATLWPSQPARVSP